MWLLAFFINLSPCEPYGDLGCNVREQIAQFLSFGPRNKLVFAPSLDPCLKAVDVGYELATLIKNHLDSQYLPMIAEDCLNSLMREAIAHDEIIGDYLAIANWGILFEPSLKFNLLSIFESFSKNNTLILVDCGHVENDKFSLVSKYHNTSFPIGDLNPCVII